MSFNFPDNPLPGQSFEPTAGTVYIWTPPVWKRLATATTDPVEEAPIDGELYGRQDGEWEIVVADVEEAPVDGAQYVRKDAGWEEVSVDVNEAPIDGLTYGRKDANWATIVGGAVISDTPPGPPLQAGQFWYEADSGNTYVWYVDADSSQWVQVNIQPAAVTTVPPGLTAETRNRVVNGAFQITQEWLKNTVYGGNGSIVADQWVVGFGTTGTVNYVIQADTSDREVVWYHRLNSSVADTSIAATEYYRLLQPIEGLRVHDFKWGTAQAKQVVVRFRARSSIIGTFSVSLLGASGYTFIKNCTFTAVNTWQDFSFVVPGPTVGTWVTDNTQAFGLGFTIMCGSTYIAPSEGAWVSGGFMGAAGISNWLSVAAQTFDVSNVGVHLDPLNTGVAPRWVMPSEGEELTACQRYYQRYTGLLQLWGYSTAGDYNHWDKLFAPSFRVAPTCAFFAVTYGSADTLTFDSSTTNTAAFRYRTAVVGRNYCYHSYAMSARM